MDWNRLPKYDALAVVNVRRRLSNEVLARPGIYGHRACWMFIQFQTKLYRAFEDINATSAPKLEVTV